jgi:cytochrome c oxidase cbb3-type subunit 3
MSNQHQRAEGADTYQDHLLEHSYDGIQEYDNPLPRWWVILFWLTIIFTPLYIVFYHYGPGPLEHERYDAAMVAFFDKQAQELLAMGEITEATLVELTEDPSMMNTGKRVFQGKCATCHGVFGEGGIGPNLTDAYWLHGSQLMDIYTTVREGVPTKGMVAWERQLRPAELMAVSSYVGTLLGTEPPNPKAPQGDAIERIPPTDAVPADDEAQPSDQDAVAS